MKENTPKNIGVPVKSLLFSLKSAVFFKSFNQTVTFGQIIDRADSGFLSLTGCTIDLPGLTGTIAAGENAFDACFSLIVDQNRTAAHLQARQKAVERIRSTEHKDCLNTEKFTGSMQPGYSVGTGNISRLIQDHRYIFAFWSYEALKTGNKNYFTADISQIFYFFHRIRNSSDRSNALTFVFGAVDFGAVAYAAA